MHILTNEPVYFPFQEQGTVRELTGGIFGVFDANPREAAWSCIRRNFERAELSSSAHLLVCSFSSVSENNTDFRLVDLGAFRFRYLWLTVCGEKQGQQSTQCVWPMG